MALMLKKVILSVFKKSITPAPPNQLKSSSQKHYLIGKNNKKRSDS